MKRRIIPVLAFLLTAGSGLLAQDPHLGFGINLSFPTGDFRSKTYPPNSDVLTSQNEGYDLGLGGQFTLSFPIEQAVAFRLNFSGQVTNGSNTAAGYEKQNLQHSIWSLGGDLQLFVNGSASRHRGTYFLGGLSADFERFERSYGDFDSYYSDDDSTAERKSRLGGNFGLGHSFGFAGTRFTLEATFHKTLSGNDLAKSEPPSSDFTRISFGWVF